MAVLGIMSYALEVPNLAAGVKFYSDAGLEAAIDADTARLKCPGQERESVILLGGARTKRLHHISMRATDIDQIKLAVRTQGGNIAEPPDGFDTAGIWITDPHGMLIHLEEAPDVAELPAFPAFRINTPGHLVRSGLSAMLPRNQYGRTRPLRLGHVLVFSPDVLKSAAFMTLALGMGLADRAQDVIAFCCATRNSEHHVVAFAKSAGIGFHHASFLVADPDEVGRAGRDLVIATGRGDWGFGRHTIGSNFFHYIQDPWGSWFEYYSDMDYIEDYAHWVPTNYGMEDSLANWGPTVPSDFVHNYEVESD